MSSARSSASPPTVEEEPRKKGSRGGKRSVTHLSKAQLARKRANDREAQRNIRQRTKEHIETLEQKVKELERYNRSGSMDSIIKRNKELEEEVENLRSQIALHSAPVVPVVPEGVTTPDEMSEDMLIPRKGSLEWSPESEPCPWPGAVSHDIANANGTYASSTSQIYPPESASIGYDNQEMEASQQIPTVTAAPVWDDHRTRGIRVLVEVHQSDPDSDSIAQ
ncbi:hypothetical protein LCER1_G005420 [Lachnellula cervina]|uniref:BZIP domain-containing protein n=1 Tax=Lachnellula cervina TaxID=1316786 RepID=A0A7D8YP37_9HELO|nr:hypothetical protein LCER1_G005420 [Lachnellula cervina]